MIKITEKLLAGAIEKINKLDKKEYTTFMDNFAKKQPGLVTYLVDNVESLSRAAARDELVYIISVIWVCYNSLNLPMARITKKEIEKAEKSQIKEWQKLAEATDPKKEESFAKKFITQPILWAFMNSMVLPEDQKKGNFRKDEDVAISYALINLITFLLDEKVNKGVIKN